MDEHHPNGATVMALLRNHDDAVRVPWRACTTAERAPTPFRASPNA